MMKNKHTIDKHLLFLFNEISENEKRDVLNHWEECDSCKQDYLQLSEIKEIYVNSSTGEPPDQLIVNLLKSVSSSKGVPSRLKWLESLRIGFRPKYGFVAAICLFLVFMIYLFLPVRENQIKIIDNPYIISNIQRPQPDGGNNMTINSKPVTFQTKKDKLRKLMTKTQKQMQFTGYDNYVILSSFTENSFDERLKNIDSRINKLISELKNDFVINIVED
jgi:hypothetical protein